ncbi:Thiamine biosynthesis protein thiI [Mycoplasmopsis bovigenitalium 51080]|uniref:Probable tRNA sulfurtransferase n=1 Tax=Mycoplasmopsis bovigenitalium 51080 TaxID=1188235 RepID=N9TS63_9BACT|nr:tRNA uracil 4-sulfurtransferase ThiI [Mycoplasmopsis bovigenitalium]ENY68920.1 Thiamine biosynthesis protein thiI [Mycoplasmopsis bovigenitalium 51080]
MYTKILIRYGELTLKGKNRQNFIDILARNVSSALGEKPQSKYDRMFVSYSLDNLEKLGNVFGISSFSPVTEVENNIDEIFNAAKQLVSEDTQTFKVSARRSNKGFELNSSQINTKLGGFILSSFPSIKVDVHNPQKNINVEVREKSTFIFTETIRGLGGLPVGVSGRVLHLMSGGIDSPVAAFELMKRGLEVTFLSFISPPQTDERTVNKMKNLINVLSKYQQKSNLILIDYSQILNYISLVSNPSFKITLLRRSFYRLASMWADKQGYIALSNGENLGQVASQTLESLSVINDSSSKLVLRPLLTKDKVETIDIAKKIGTYEISIIPANETCELFAPKEPVTKPKLTQVERLENELSELKNFECNIIEKNVEIIKIK